jgi:DNA replication protein DnaC
MARESAAGARRGRPLPAPVTPTPAAPAAPADVTARLRQHLAVLGLTHVAAHLDDYLAWALHAQPAPVEMLDRVLGEEAAVKRQKRIERRIGLSGLRERKTLEAFDWAFQPSLDRAVFADLARCDWVRRADDLLLTGPTGTGKSHLLMALGLKACEHQLAVRYARGVDLLGDLFAGLADGTYPTRLKAWCAPQLLLIDDVGLGQLKQRDDEPTAAHALFTLIDRRHTRAATALTSNLPLSAWGRYLGDATLAAAILDRLAMRALRIDIDGPSYRQRVAHERARARGPQPLPGPATSTSTPTPTPTPP